MTVSSSVGVTFGDVAEVRMLALQDWLSPPLGGLFWGLADGDLVEIEFTECDEGSEFPSVDDDAFNFFCGETLWG